jgi:hypothetical protein
VSPEEISDAIIDFQNETGVLIRWNFFNASEIHTPRGAMEALSRFLAMRIHAISERDVNYESTSS